jgi:hypothetical protein
MNRVFLAVSVKVANVWIKIVVFYLDKIRAETDKVRTLRYSNIERGVSDRFC